MPNISVTHADSGLMLTQVKHTQRISPHIQRVTFAGGDLDKFEYKGFDQWFRLAIPVRSDDRLDNLPKKFGLGGALKYFTLPKGTRPVIRNYTIRNFRPDSSELDVDFVVHGDTGVAGPWSQTAEPGHQVALIDQGCGWQPVQARSSLIVADESGMPAALGILRDMPRDAIGHAVIEVFDEADQQDVDAPPGMDVHWLVRDLDSDPGTLAVPKVEELELDTDLYGFAVGESSLVKAVRRHLVNDRGIPKSHVTFSGYWRMGKAAPS